MSRGQGAGFNAFDALDVKPGTGKGKKKNRRNKNKQAAAQEPAADEVASVAPVVDVPPAPVDDDNDGFQTNRSSSSNSVQLTGLKPKALIFDSPEKQTPTTKQGVQSVFGTTSTKE